MVHLSLNSILKTAPAEILFAGEQGSVLFLPAMIFATDKHDVMVQQDALGK
jgi:hypothetical protein